MTQSYARLAAVMLGVSTVAPLAAVAQDERIAINQPEQPLDQALRQLAVTAGRSIIAPTEAVAGKMAPALTGRHTVAEAIALLLAGSGLQANLVGTSFVVGPAADAAQANLPQSDVVVTGTRIRGAAVASQTITIPAETIRREGQATIAEAASTLPQNFGGGQNPGIGQNIPTASGVNVGSGSSFNLRGLGSDATLTLLNGHRLSYSASRQSVDLTTIPLDIVDRVEIVADGSSAIYGSDAVAGVANIVLRRDASGLTTRARVGVPTDGGGLEQIYGASAGARWQGGGAIIAYEYRNTDAIRSSDRSYAQAKPGLDLFPAIRRHNAAASLHQSLGDAIDLGIDGFYNHRSSTTVYPLNAAGDLSVSRAELPSHSDSFLVAPMVAVRVGGGWRMELSGSYGKDRVQYASNSYTGTRLSSSASGCYCNDVRTIELSGDGPVFDLPGGAARLAIGAGIRDIGLENFRGAGNIQNFDVRQQNRFVYGEASLPIVGEAANLNWLRTLTATAALRYEDYPGVNSVVTPKLGLLLSPAGWLTFKGTWGKSFRAPTLYQRYQTLIAAAFPPASFGGRGYPSGSAVLLLTGGRQALKPERATSWSVGAVVKPDAIEGARLEATYFHTTYRDRIVAPIAFISQALTNPIYAGQITLAPSATAVAAAVANAGQFLNGTGATFDPSRVVAIVDNANVNAARQHLEGVDTLLAYSHRLGSGEKTISASANASYLTSEQQLTNLQPTTTLAGTLFNPPHFRARATLSFATRGFTTTSAYNRIGGVLDTRTSSAVNIGGMNTFDITLSYTVSKTRSILGGLSVLLTVQNLFNDKPAVIATTLPYETPYDSTNYSPVGRFIAFGISKSW